MVEHTPEPWIARTASEPTYPKGEVTVIELYVAVAPDQKGDGDAIASNIVNPLTGSLDAVAWANARRICAAVNACKGITTEALESGVVAELLAACKAAMYPAGDTPEQVQAQLRDAIAKAKGIPQ